MSFLQDLLKRVPDLLNPKDLRFLDRVIHESVYKKYGYPEHEHYAYWERQAQYWHGSVPPICPSAEEIEIYRKNIDTLNDIKTVLVLGSTPEIRDTVALKTDAKIYVADFSFNMIVAMLSHTKHVDQLREKWIKDNWLDLAFPPRYFDLIIGDVVLHQLTPQFEDAFLAKVASLLSKTGMFLTRVFFLDDSFLRGNFSAIAKKTIETTSTERACSTLLRLQAVWFSTDPTTRKFNRTKALGYMKPIREQYASNRAVRHAYEVLERDVSSYRNWAPPSEQELYTLLQKNFTIESTTFAKDYPEAQFFPILSLRSRC